MTENELRQLIAEAEQEGRTPRLYRLWCEHITTVGASEVSLKDGELSPARRAT